MAKFCDDDCATICDFCKHYKDNGDSLNYEGEGGLDCQWGEKGNG